MKRSRNLTADSYVRIMTHALYTRAMKPLKGKVVLITGGAKNLGRTIALELANQGASIAINYYKSKREAQSLLTKINKISQGIIVQANVAKKEDVTVMFLDIKERLGEVDILINLVGNFIFDPITHTTFEQFRDVIETNLYSTFLCSEEALPHMVKRRWGRIINFGCAGADSMTIREKTTPYYIAKTGVIMLTKVMAFEYAKYGITVNSISPGILQSSVSKPKTPTGTYIQFKDIVNTLLFFLNSQSHAINGANIEVAAGFRLGFSN